MCLLWGRSFLLIKALQEIPTFSDPPAQRTVQQFIPEPIRLIAKIKHHTLAAYNTNYAHVGLAIVTKSLSSLSMVFTVFSLKNYFTPENTLTAFAVLLFLAYRCSHCWVTITTLLLHSIFQLKSCTREALAAHSHPWTPLLGYLLLYVFVNIETPCAGEIIQRLCSCYWLISFRIMSIWYMCQHLLL